MGSAPASVWYSFAKRAFLPVESGIKYTTVFSLRVPQYMKFKTSKLISIQNVLSGSSSEKGCDRLLRALPSIGDFFWEKEPTPFLDMVEAPIHLKNLSPKELKQLADELRSEISFLISKACRSSQSMLAVVELTVAIHYVFNAPVDKILWDVGEQTYAHKILTGRRFLLHTLKRKNGILCFSSLLESEYDAFGAGHGCSSISAGLGMAVARDIKGKKDRVIAVISNWSTMAGQAYEAMGNAGYLDSNMVVILNDSRHSLFPKPEENQKTPINALSSILSKLQSSKSFRKLREAAKVITKRVGRGMHELAAKVDEYARGMIGPLGATLFEELGLYYIGPVDGHNIDDLISVLSQVATLDSTGPVLVHVITDEGLEATSQRARASEHQGGTLIPVSQASYPKICHTLCKTYNDLLVEALIAEAEKDTNIVIVHAGMGIEPSLQPFQSKFPDRFFDVGMAEQHAVTFAAGLSCGGLKPFCLIQSTYLQRAYDQIVEDVDLQRVPVRFAITGAGMAGSRGSAECGSFDITFMACLPNMIVMAPCNEDELIDMVATAAQISDNPVCFRFPGGVAIGTTNPLKIVSPLEIGKGELVVEGRNVALLGYGVMVQNCLKACSLLTNLNIEVTVANARFCKPLDIDLIRKLCSEHEFLITVEEGAVGGFGAHVSQFMALDGLLDGRIKWRPMVLPDNYIEHASPHEQLDIAGLSGHHIAATVLSLLGRNREALQLIH